MKRIVLTFLTLFFSGMLNAADCFDLAGRDYKIDPDLLRAIAWNESHYNPEATGSNIDGSFDMSLMQINSQHLPALQKMGISQASLMNDPCMNIYTGAYILALAFKKWGVNWQAVGAYNAGFLKTDKQALRRYYYARRIENTYRVMKASHSSTGYLKGH